MTGPAISQARFGARNAQPLDDLMKDARSIAAGLFDQANPDDMPLEARQEQERVARVRAIAARKFGDDDGLELLEALCDATVRRPITLGPIGKTCEEVALYARQREGQNETLFMLLAWIAEGRSEQPPQREGKIHADTKLATRNKRAARSGRGSGRRRA